MAGEEPTAPASRREASLPQQQPRRALHETAAQAPQSLAEATLAERLWLCIRMAHLALESSVCTVSPEEAGTARVVVAGVGAQGRVVDLNDAALAAGIHPGMGLNAAYALAPWLLTVPSDERRVAAALERLANWAMRFTSIVEPRPPDALLLEVRGSLRLFGGYEPLSSQIRHDLARLGYTATLALAPTPLGAVLLARGACEQPVFHAAQLTGALGVLPLTCLRWPDKVIERLQGMGVRRLGDCLRLPRAGFARRFGKLRLQELDRAVGREADPVTPWQAPLRFSSRCELPAPMQAVQLLEVALARLVAELQGFLVSRQAAVRRLRVDLLLEDRTVQSMSLALVTPVTDTAYLMDLLRERLEQQHLQAPVIEVELQALEVDTCSAGNGDLFDRAPRVEEDAQRLLERLRTRLGEQSVHGITQVADHRPEVAWHRVEPGTPAPPVPLRQRPLWILHQPQRLAEDGAGLPCRRRGGPALVLEQGPERIESGWWDGADVRRDYYVARDAYSVRLWVYRDGRSGIWYLHGIFA